MSSYDLLEAVYDEPAHRPVTRRYVIASVPRSGSTLLAEGLMAAGLGVPAEYFDLDATVPKLAARWGVSDMDAYLERLYGLRSRNGVFGLKIHWHQLVFVVNEALGRDRNADLAYEHARRVLEHFIPDPVYVRIRRRDLDRQTVSHFVASGTGRWVDTGSGGEWPSLPPYDFEHLERIRAYLTLCEAAWDRYFELAGLSPHTVTYEDLVSDYQATVSAVASHLGGDGGPVPPPRLRRQASDATEEMVARYRAERRRHAPVPA